ncbi:MAG: sulfurtransferase [Chloroflexota bacterium]
MTAAPSPLTDAQTLASRLGSPGLVVADVRWYLGKPGEGRRRYDEAHVPGAIFVDVDTELTARDGPGRHPLPSVSEFAARMSALGIGDTDEVVAYDDVGGTIAARLWWMLDVLGRRATVLDGGLPAWLAAGLPVTSEPSRLPPATFTPLARTWPGTVDRETLKARLGSVVVLDARAGARYRGEIEPIDPAPGHIPTAISAPADANLGADGRFLPPKALRETFGAFGGDVVTSCGSGITACHNALAMRAAGLPDPLLYPGSYSDWSRSGEPVATGPEPGAMPAARADAP